MKSRKFLWSGVLILSVLLFATYLVPNIYLGGNKVLRETNINSIYRSDNYNYSNRWGSGYGMMGSYRGRGMMGEYGGMMGRNFR